MTNLNTAASVVPASWHLKATDEYGDIIPTISVGRAIKIDGLVISNVEGASAQSFSLQIWDGAVARTLADEIDVPAKATLEFFSRPFWLTEGQSLIAKSTAADLIQFTASGLEFS